MSNKSGGLTRYQQQQKGKGGNIGKRTDSSNSSGYSKGGGNSKYNGGASNQRFGGDLPVDRIQQRMDGDEIDLQFGFDRVTEGAPRLGWLLNYLAISMADESGLERSGMDLYYIDREGKNFKATVFFQPYFYVGMAEDNQGRAFEVSQHIEKRVDGCRVQIVDKEDLDLPGHLSGKKSKYLKLSFNTVSELMEAKQILKKKVDENLKRISGEEYEEDTGGDKRQTASADPLTFISDIREFDVPYAMRVSIDLDLRVGAWYVVTPIVGSEVCSVEWQQEMLELCEPRVLAFDIECEKSPLKFPNAANDRIFMISYMISGQGYLLINREVVSKDIDDFEYTPNEKYPGPFKVYNHKNEEELLRFFVDHIQTLRPHVIVTYNGDFFDWPYVETRCGKYSGLDLFKSLGIKSNKVADASGRGSEGEYTGRCTVHLDAFCWVKRDSYLPQGSQGLKNVTKNKLGYNPAEIDPEDMVRFAQEKPDVMASYSVSDAVATYYLYQTYVHNFIFSLSTIIPLAAEDVLRKGSGTLCEALLMVEAYRGNIVCPNKQIDPLESFHEGHLIESQTYIGGHVECLEAGVYRADIPSKFNLAPSALQSLINHIDRDLVFALETEHGTQRSNITNYDQVKQDIIEKLENLRDNPVRDEKPLIYHLDVGAMYPNIILTNRLQPSSMVSLADCAGCEFNRPASNCKRPMEWTWRGEFSPATLGDYHSVKRQLSYEKVGDRPFFELAEREQAGMIKSRLKKYSASVYKKTKIVLEKKRENTVCMRENPFYVDTVRAFRDRRYDYKLLTKKWKSEKGAADKRGDAVARKACEDKEILMDSLQLAHKCILNSFYGYVMRKGARWRSIEMAGIVTHTGSNIITQARELVEQVGRPLELDTDGIWCILPTSFPDKFKFVSDSGESISISYPCAMLNADVHDRYTNHQYQDRQGNTAEKKFAVKSECSIYFELDGPYKAMVLPASAEEGVLLKKKYVVYNFNGTIAELKGFELKRRGELELVKNFQEEVFDQFLAGTTLEECYKTVGDVANRWLDVLDNKGVYMSDESLMELISERKTISKTLEDYEGRKATSLTTAGRLADFLGAEMVKDKGLNCNLIISRLPAGAPVTERALPVAIFSAEPSVRKHYLRKWLKEDVDDFRDVVDWEYYKERLAKTIQKIITIPAGMQNVPNPCPRIDHPSWLQRNIDESSGGKKQKKISDMFKSMKLVGPNLVSTDATPRKKGSGGVSIYSALLSGSSKKRDREAEGESSDAIAHPVMDLEDIAGEGRGMKAGVPVAHFLRKSVSFEDSPNPDPISSSREASPSHVHTAAEDSLGTSVDEAAEVLPMYMHKPQSADELQAWVVDRKKRWSKQLAEKKKLRKMNLTHADELSTLSRKKVLGLDDFVRKANLEAATKPWQVMEVQHTETPGEFILWALISSGGGGQSQLQRFRLTIPRVFYVNCRGPNAEESALALDGVRVKRDLPRGRTCHQLYEVRISERKFIRNEKALQQFLGDAQVEGVYETQLPLLFRALSELGCVCRLAKNGSSPVGSNSYRLDELDKCNVGTHFPYLEGSSSVYRRIYMYQTSDRSRRSGFGAVGLFVIDKGSHAESVAPVSATAYVWICNGGNLSDSRPPFNRQYREYQPDERASVRFGAVNFVRDMAECLRLCNERLNAYSRDRTNGATLVVAQGALGADSRQWRRSLPALQEFPLLLMPFNSEDGMYPALGWQVFLSARMIQRFLVLPQFFLDRLHSSRFSEIPVCNLGRDAPTSMIDVIFARQLRHNRHLLWASESNCPDIGGAEADEHLVSWSDALQEPVISEAGVYRSICVEIAVEAMDICAILSSGLLDAEGLTATAPSASSGASDGSAVYSDTASARAFNLLKALISKWYDDAVYRDDPIADNLLQSKSLYRYLCGYGNSLLSDPALHRIVYGLMTRLFKRLVGDLKKLGAKIVYADFHKIIIHTKKQDLDAAREYAKYIIDTVLTKDLYQYLDGHIVEKCYWQQLLWTGPDNWAGIAAEAPEEAPGDAYGREMAGDDVLADSYNTYEESAFMQAVVESGNSDVGDRASKSDGELDWLYNGETDEYQDEDDGGAPVDEIDEEEGGEEGGREEEGDEEERDEDPYFKYQWHLARTLSDVGSHYFNFFVRNFLYAYKKKRQQLCERRDARLLELRGCGSLKEECFNAALLGDEEMDVAINGYMSKLVVRNIGNELLKVIDDMALHEGHSLGAGMKQAMTTHILDFIKAVTHVFALDANLTDEVATLRRMLLAQVHVKEFSDDGVYKDTKESYVLNDVICNFCGVTKNIDLLRDEVLLQSSKEDRWKCEKCNHLLDTQEIEQRLVDECERLSTSYLLQDMRCSVSNTMVVRLCAATSSMCAPLKMIVGPAEIRGKLELMRKIAGMQGFDYLEYIAQALAD